MKTKITITEALAKLKLLQKRIDNGIRSLAVVGYQQRNKMQSPHSHMEISDFENNAKRDLQSVEDLINQITIIKTSINKSNSITVVKICGREMTVQEALVEKTLIENKKTLLVRLKSLKDNTNRSFQSCTEAVHAEIDKLRESLSSSKDSKKEDVEDICERTLNLKYPKMVDPCDLSKKIETLEKEIEDFENNVDYALSEINSNTYIEV